MRAAFLYTGQGWQHPGMLHELPECEEKDQYFKMASEVLGRNIEELDSRENLCSNEFVQLCIFLYETVLTKRALQLCECEMVSGHSIGSFAAAVISGTICFEQALELVQTRGRKMEEGYGSGYGMMAVQGLTHGLGAKVLENFKISDPGAVVYLAALNEELQCVFSGKQDDLQQFRECIHQNYPVKSQFIKVKVPSHCPLMHPVAELLETMTEKVDWKFVKIPYLSNSTADRVWRSGQIRLDLIHGVERPVKWYEGITMMKELGVEYFVEISGAGTLTDIGRRSYPELCWHRWTPQTAV